MKRGRKSTAEKLSAKSSNDLCTNVPLSIRQKLLGKVMKNIEGKGRSEKICNCIEAGYKAITGETA